MTNKHLPEFLIFKIKEEDNTPEVVVVSNLGMQPAKIEYLLTPWKHTSFHIVLQEAKRSIVISQKNITEIVLKLNL